MAKKSIILSLVFIFLISFASAFDWDNTYRYNETTRTAVIENAFGLGDDLAVLTLTSEDQAFVHMGIDTLVGEFNLTTTDNLTDVLQSLELTNLKNGQIMTRGKQYKVKIYKEVNVDDYETVCENITSINGTNGTNCYKEEIGNHKEIETEWLPITNPNFEFISGVTYEIGIFVDVEKGDYGDWIPHIMGESISEWAVWREYLYTDLISYYYLTNSSGVVYDMIRANDGTNNGADRGVTGINNNAFDFENSDIDYISLSSTTIDEDLSNTELTINMWVKPEVNYNSGTSIRTLFDIFGNSERMKLDYTSGDFTATYGGAIGSYTTDLTAGTWYMVTMKITSTYVRIYVDGVEEDATTYTGGLNDFGTSATTHVGENYALSTGRSWDGYIDELMIWGRDLNQTEISELYDSGTGQFYVKPITDFPPSVKLTSPTHYANLTSGNIDFIATVTDDQYVENVTFYFDGIANETRTTHVNGSYTFTKTIDEGLHNWSILAYDNNSQLNQSETRLVNYTQPPLFIDLLNPSDLYVSNIPIVNISCRAYATEGVEQLNLTINNVVNKTVVNTTVGQNLSIEGDISFTEGIYTWGCQAKNSMSEEQSANRTLNVSYSIPIITYNAPINYANLSSIPVTFNITATDVNGISSVEFYLDGVLNETNSSGFNGTYILSKSVTSGDHNWSITAISTKSKSKVGSTKYFSIDVSPPVINITAPNGTLESAPIGANETLDYSITDPNLDSCWYEYFNVNYSLNCSANTTSFGYIEGEDNITVFANDTYGLTGSSTKTWSYLFEKFNLTYESPVYEGSLNAFSTNIRLGGGATITQAIFNFDDTNYTTNIIFSGGEYLVSSSITAPVVTNDTNLSFGFYIVIDGNTYKPRTDTQEVLNVEIGACGVGEDLLLNISLLDEGQRVSLTGDIELNAQLIGKVTEEITDSLNITFEDVKYGAICLTPTVAKENFYLDVEIRYDSTDYARELYNIQKANLSEYPKNLSVFDLALNDSTEFLIKYQDDSLIPVEGAVVQLQRKYIGSDVFELVEAPLTSDIGTAIVHIDLNTNLYQATIVKDGVVLDIFPNLVFHCENELSGQCTENLLGKIDPQNVVTLEELTDFTYSVSEANNTITTLFSIPSGTPSSINILLSQTDVFGNTSLCNQTIISSAGSIDCTYQDTMGDSIIELIIKKDGEQKATESYIIPEDTGVEWLDNNYFIVFILGLSLVGMGFSSPEWIVINSVIVLLLGGGLWLLNGLSIVMGLAGVIWLIVSAGILIKEMSKQEDR